MSAQTGHRRVVAQLRATSAARRGSASSASPAAHERAEPAVAFAVADPGAAAGIEVRVNFGVWAGREVSPAEIDRLARWLLDRVDQVSIVSEVRHEIDRRSEAAVHQIRITVAAAEPERAELERWLVDRVEYWARLCLSERTSETVSGAA